MLDRLGISPDESGSHAAQEFPDCSICHTPILDTVVVQDEKSHHLGCVDQSRPWSELKQQGGPPQQVAPKARFGESDLPIVAIVVNQLKEHGLVLQGELRRGQLSSSLVGKVMKFYFEIEREDTKQKVLQKRLKAFCAFGGKLRVKDVEGKMWVLTEPDEKIVALNVNQVEAFQALIEVWKDMRDALRSPFSEELAEVLFPATWQSWTGERPAWVYKYRLFGLQMYELRTEDEVQDAKETYHKVLDDYIQVVVSGTGTAREAAKSFESDWSMTGGPLGRRLAYNALRAGYAEYEAKEGDRACSPPLPLSRWDMR